MKKIYFFFLVLISNFLIGQNEFLEEFVSIGIDFPVEITHAGDERLFVLEKEGIIKIVNPDGSINSEPFLDIRQFVISEGEMGLLGLAFHPNYASNREFFIFYNESVNSIIIAKYMVSDNPDIANTNGEIILNILESTGIHVGGSLKFDSQGYLWISVGNGANDNTSQNKNSYRGKILRIDINSSPYSIPPENPFLNEEGLDEIWAMGLRNPWKFSFDRITNEVWISDVGQELNQNSIGFEEVNKQSESIPGLNYGFKCYIGNIPFQNCGVEDQFLTFPFSGYPYSTENNRNAIIGGYVYRGNDYPNLYGRYIFADYSSKEIGVIDQNGTVNFYGPFSNQLSRISTLGEGIDGQLYIGDFNNKKIYKIKDVTLFTKEENKLSLAISPNPVVDFLNISSNLPIDRIQIYTVDGKLIQTLSGRNQIDFLNFEKGVYLVVVEVGKTIKTFKILK
jgi:glucose/arabinose dehydrogenase